MSTGWSIGQKEDQEKREKVLMWLGLEQGHLLNLHFATGIGLLALLPYTGKGDTALKFLHLVPGDPKSLSKKCF